MLLLDESSMEGSCKTGRFQPNSPQNMIYNYSRDEVMREIPFAAGCKVKLQHLFHYALSLLEAHHL